MDERPSSPDDDRDRSTVDGGEQQAVDVAVVGGGLAGLTAAVTAARAGATVALVDAGRVGGRARATVVDPGVVFNAGPRALYLGGAAARELSALGVRWHGGVPATAASRARRDGVDHVMPGTPGQLLRTRLLGPAGKARVGWLLGTIARRDPSALVGRSVTDWVEGLGLGHDAAGLVLAVVRLATYVDDPDHLDAGAALAQLQLALGRGVLYLDGGWQTLVDQLLATAVGAGVVVHDHASVRSVSSRSGTPASSADGWVVATAGRSLLARSVVLAAGTPAAAAGLSPVGLRLDGVGRPVTAACWELAVRGTPPVRFLLGIDRPLYLSQHGPPAHLAPEGISVVHVLRYGVTESDAEADRAEMWDHAQAAGVTRGDIVAQRHLRRMVVSGAAPLAASGGLAGRPPVTVAGAPGLFLAGDWVGDDGMLADAAVASGVLAGRRAATAATARAGTEAVLGDGAQRGVVGTGWAR